MLQICPSSVECSAFASVTFWEVPTFERPSSSSPNDQTDPFPTQFYLRYFWHTRWSIQLCRGNCLSGRRAVSPLSCAQSSSVSGCTAAGDVMCVDARFWCNCAIVPYKSMMADDPRLDKIINHYISATAWPIVGPRCFKKPILADPFSSKNAKYWNFCTIKATAVITTKFCTMIKTTKYFLQLIPKSTQQIRDVKTDNYLYTSATIWPILMIYRSHHFFLPKDVSFEYSVDSALCFEAKCL